MRAATGAGLAAAIDVGGTTIKGILIDVTGQRQESIVRPTQAENGPGAVLSAVRTVVAELAGAAGSGLRAVGLAVPGVVSGGVARWAANLGWRDLPAAAFTEGIVRGVPVLLDHDVRCAAVAERELGTLRGVGDGCFVAIGTGIAAVLVTGGQPVIGARAMAGELGHIPAVPGGEPCACGQRGCLEVYASAAGLARRYAARAGTARSAYEVEVAAAAGDPDAARVWQDAVAALATACVTVTLLHDPAVITFAGGLAEAKDALIVPLAGAVTAGLAWRSPPVLAVSPLASWAGRYGIALRAWAAAGVTIDPDVWARAASAGRPGSTSPR